MCFLSHSFVALAVCFGSLSCWNTQTQPIFTTHGVFGVIGSIPPPPNTASWADAKSWILVSSDHNTFTQFSSESLANLRRTCTCVLVWAGRPCGHCRISVLHGVVLPIVFLLTMVPAALSLLIRSSRVVLGLFLTVLMITETPRGEILHGAPVRGRLIVFFCDLRIVSPTVVTFSPSCLPMVL